MPTLPTALPRRTAARHLAALAFALAAPALTLVSAQATDAAPAAETKWEELVPKGWNPLASFKMPPGVSMLNDSDPRVMDMMQEMREVWDNAPTRNELDGSTVRLSGYVVPLEQVKGETKEFLLVPYFGACIHSPPPPANQIVHVFAPPEAKAAKGLKSMDVVTVQGTLRTARSDSAMGASGYRIDAAGIEPYVAPPVK